MYFETNLPDAAADAQRSISSRFAKIGASSTDETLSHCLCGRVDSALLSVLAVDDSRSSC